MEKITPGHVRLPKGEETTKDQTKPSIAKAESAQVRSLTWQRSGVLRAWENLPRALRETLLGKSANINELTRIKDSLPRWHELQPTLQQAIDLRRKEAEEVIKLPPQAALRALIRKRMQQGQTLEEIARQAEVSTVMLGNMATGTCAMRNEKELAKALDVPEYVLKPKTNEADPLGILQVIRTEIQAQGSNLRERSCALGHHYSYLSVQLAQLENGNAISTASASKLLAAAGMQITVNDLPLNHPEVLKLAQSLKPQYTELARQLGIDRRTLQRALEGKPQPRSNHLIHAWRAAGQRIGI